MKFYVLKTESKGVTAIQNELPMVAVGGGRGPTVVTANRRSCSSRSVLIVALVLGVLFPFVFFGIAFEILESPVCSSFECSLWKFFGSRNEYLLREELMRALLEVSDRKGQGAAEESGSMDNSVESFNELARDMMSITKDIKTFAFKAKAMLSKMESKVYAARNRESIYWYLAARGVPKSLHCLVLSLDEEYSLNFRARSHLPSPEYFPSLADPSFHHIVLITDNVLAASVVLNSTIQSSVNPEKLVFHIVTDKKTYTAMLAWFAINPFESSIVEVKGLHQYNWSPEVNAEIEEIVDIYQLIWTKYREVIHQTSIDCDIKFDSFMSDSYSSLLSHLRLYVPELFPGLNRIVFLDDDTVVQRDLSALWDIDLKGKVIGAVVDSWNGDACCLGKNNTSDKCSEDECGWLLGMSVMDLQAWRGSNITKAYHYWLKLILNSGLKLCGPGVLPPFSLAFRGHVHPLDPKWHVAGLGQRSSQVKPEVLEAAAVIHFSGPAKPWLEISNPEVKTLWTRHVDFSNKFIRKCYLLGDVNEVLSLITNYTVVET